MSDDTRSVMSGTSVNSRASGMDASVTYTRFSKFDELFAPTFLQILIFLIYFIHILDFFNTYILTKWYFKFIFN